MKASLIAILMAAASLYAQSTRGSIGGQVTDADKKPVSGAAVTLVNQETNQKRTGASGSQGEFLVTLLDPEPTASKLTRTRHHNSSETWSSIWIRRSASTLASA